MPTEEVEAGPPFLPQESMVGGLPTHVSTCSRNQKEKALSIYMLPLGLSYLISKSISWQTSTWKILIRYRLLGVLGFGSEGLQTSREVRGHWRLLRSTEGLQRSPC